MDPTRPTSSGAVSTRPRRLIAALAAAGTAGLLTTGALLSGAGSAAAAVTSPDGTATVARTGSGSGALYRLTLRLPAPLAVRDALPELAVDGRSLGLARESRDGRTLSVTTTDPAAARGRVQLAWNGQVPTTTGATGVSAKRLRALTELAPSLGQTVAGNPAAPGAYGVRRADYDLGDTVLTLPTLGGNPVEARAAVWLPVGAPGARPVVVFLHGRHSACYDPVAQTSSNNAWPCPTGQQPIPSYLGYNQAAQALASHGYAVVSISADGINAQDNPLSDDAGTTARGELVLDHLDLLAAANAGRAPGLSTALKGHLDLTHVGLMGHSRGGEGVVKAALLNAGRAKPYGIEAVMPLAPIDFGRETLPDVPMAVILPYCDGDVSNQQGQHFYEDSRYADAAGRDGVARSSLLVMGADHNFFNTEWTPGVAVAPARDDWYDDTDPTCSTTQPTSIRLTAAQQHDVGTRLMTGFFRLVMGGETQFRALFDGSQGRSTSVGAAQVYTQAQTASGSRLDVAPLTGPDPSVRATGPALAQYCASIGLGRSPSSPLPSCSAATETSRFPMFTPANYASNVPATPLLHLSWDAPLAGEDPARVAMDLPAGARDVTRYAGLTLRASRDDAPTGAPVPAVDLAVSVVDGHGRIASAPLSSLSDALYVLPGTDTRLLPKVWQRTVVWPLARMKGVDLHDLRQVRLTAASPTGSVYLSDVAFQAASVGSGGPSPLPQVSVDDVTVAEGDGPGLVPVTVRLSRASGTAVTASVQSISRASGQVLSQAQPVTFPAGSTTATVQVPLDGNTAAGPDASTYYKVFVSVPTGAVLGQQFARITVTDDDGPIPTPSPTPTG